MKRRKTNYLKLYNPINIIVLMLIFIGLIGFESKKENEPIEPFKIPKIVGLEETTSLCLSPKHMLNAWYNIERIDTISDILDLSKPAKSTKGLFYEFYETLPLEKRASNVGLTIIVDTINELTMTKKPIWARYLFHRVFSDSKEILQDDTLIQQVKSFPIYVANLSQNHPASIEVQDGSIMMVVEAINQKNQWQPIEYWSGSWCGNSYYTVLLPPRNILMTRGIKCSGDFYTKCRMKVTNREKQIYSNEFYMSINETQFEEPMKKDY